MVVQWRGAEEGGLGKGLYRRVEGELNVPASQRTKRQSNEGLKGKI